jgi:hypothetical protein
MNQKLSKPLSEFTEKQAQAYKLAMKASARKPLTKRQLYQLIKSEKIYSSPRDCKEVTEMLVKNPNTPIRFQDGEITNELA